MKRYQRDMHGYGENAFWRPENDTNKFYGPTRLRTALAQSRNPNCGRTDIGARCVRANSSSRYHGQACARPRDGLDIYQNKAHKTLNYSTIY